MSGDRKPTVLGRNVLRGTAIVISLGLIVLWVRFARGLFLGSTSLPSPGGIMLPVFFCTLALGAALAAWRGDGIPVALAGGIALVPMGLLMAFIPGASRLIGLFDVGLIVLGILLMRTEEIGVE